MDPAPCDVDVATMDIPSFYAGQSIFLTGGTGFLGKVGGACQIPTHDHCDPSAMQSHSHFHA